MTGGIATSTPPFPATDLDATLSGAFRLIAAGVADRRGPFRTPTLATVGLDGTPQQRTVVLRCFDAEARTCEVHTDRRSAKVAEVLREPRVALHAYEPAAAVQIRLSGLATLHHGPDALADAAWAAAHPSSRLSYASDFVPGSTVPEPPPAPTDSAAARDRFAVLLLRFDALEWLWLAPHGHRRARFAWDAEGRLAATWLVP